MSYGLMDDERGEHSSTDDEKCLSRPTRDDKSSLIRRVAAPLVCGNNTVHARRSRVPSGIYCLLAELVSRARRYAVSVRPWYPSTRVVIRLAIRQRSTQMTMLTVSDGDTSRRNMAAMEPLVKMADGD